MKRRDFHIATACSLAAVTFGLPLSAASQENYPTKPIRLIVSYGAGGSLDAIARPLAVEMGKLLGQSVIVDNVPGGGGSIGVRRVRDAAPDGYTLLVGTASEVALAPFTVKAASYQATDVTAIGKVATSGLVLAAGEKVPASNLQELIVLARTKPGSLSYGVPGAGSFHHVVMETLKRRAGIDITLVPYSGTAQVITDILGNHVELGMVGLPAVAPMIDQGRVKPLAVMSRDRDIAKPNVPAARETKSLENFDFELWTGLFAPPRTPPAIVARLHDALSKSLASPALVDAYRNVGIKVAPPQARDAFAAYVVSEQAKLKDAVMQSGIAPQ